LGKRNVGIDGFGTAHHFDRAVIEFRGDAAFGLVLAPGDHADAGDEHDGRVRIAHGGRVVVCAHRVILGVVLAIGFESSGQLVFQDGCVVLLWIPIHVKRLDFRAEEMVGAARA